MFIEEAELKLRETVCAEFRVNVSDIFKRGKPSELRRKIEKRMNELRSSKPVISAFDEYKELVSQPVKRGRGRPRKNPLPISDPPSVADRLDWIDDPIPQGPSKLNKKLSRVLPKKEVEEDEDKYASYKYANPNPPPLHDIDMSKVKFNPKTDVPKFLRVK